MTRSQWFLFLALVAMVAVIVTRPRSSRQELEAPIEDEVPPVEAAAVSKPARPIQAIPSPESVSPSEFQNLVDSTLETLPTIEQVRSHAFNPHMAPPQLLQTAPSLGKVEATLRAYPELIPQGMDFYHRCATTDGVLTAVRTLCLRNLKYWSSVQPGVLEIDLSEYPEAVVRLSDMLPPVTQ